MALPIAASAQIDVPAGAGDLVSLTITSVVNPKNPANMSNIGRSGDTIIVNGRGFTRTSSMVLIWGEPNNMGGSRPSTLNKHLNIAVAPFRTTSTSMHFVAPSNIAIPYAGPGATGSSPYFVEITRGPVSVTSKLPILLLPAAAIRKITSVEQLVVRSTMRLKIHGVGFNDKLASIPTYFGITGGYFGVGTPGSTTNPRISVGNRSDTYVELWLDRTCDQDGILMLAADRPGGGSEDLILGDTPFHVGCAKDTPTGFIVGSESSVNGIVNYMAGSMISIRGTDLRYVTKVIDSQGNSYPFSFANIGPFEQLSVTLPGPKPGGGYAIQFFLENKLTDPVVAGTVTGIVSIMAGPTWNRISPAWAEAGQKVTVGGRDISSGPGDVPTVTVGGVAAQVIKSDNLTIEFRLGAGTTGGPIVIKNRVGTAQLTGPFTSGSGPQHPGFFVVAGSSVVQSITAPGPTLADGDIVVVKGQNIARLGGICVLGLGLDKASDGSQPGTLVQLNRLEYGGSTTGDVATNTEMKVRVPWVANLAKGTGVQLLAPNLPPGDVPATSFACAPNSTSVIWPTGAAGAPPPAAPPISPSAPLTLSLTTGAGISVSSPPTCTDGTRLFNVTGSAPNFSVSVTSPGTYTLTCTFDVSAPGSPPPNNSPPAASDPDPVTDAPVSSGSFRVNLPGGARTGKASFCSMPAMDGLLAVYMEGDGITGGITGRKAKKGAGTYPVLAGGDGGFEINVVRSAPTFATYTGESGELRITSWTGTLLAGTFRIKGHVNDTEGLQQEHSVTGSFTATPLGGC